MNYAAQQHQNAVTARTDFQNTRWELLELDELEAWANAAAQDQDDEVHLTISGYTYYNVSDTRRSLVVQDLERKRTLIAQNNEADRLAARSRPRKPTRTSPRRSVAQAQAGVATAQQRVVVAQLQQRQAEDNRDFLDMSEFSARLWYEIARMMKRPGRRLPRRRDQSRSSWSAPTPQKPPATCTRSGFDYRNAGAATCWAPTCCCATSTTSP